MMNTHFNLLFCSFESFDQGISSNFRELHLISTVFSPGETISDGEVEFGLIDDIDFDVIVFVLEGDGGFGRLHI